MSAASHRRSKEQRRLQQEQLKVQQAAAERRRGQRRLLGIVAISLVVLVVGGGVALQAWRTSRGPSAVPAAVTSGAPSFGPVNIEGGKPIVLGKTSATVKVQLYEDFHCAHCVEFQQKFGPTLTTRQAQGVLAVELYPMSFIDSGSTSSANAMACAAEAGFGQGYYAGLFANASLTWQDSQLLDLAKKVTPSVPKAFAACVTAKTQSAWVDSINATAASNGVKQTPTMFLDGTPVDIDKLTPETLTAMIDAAAKS